MKDAADGEGHRDPTAKFPRSGASVGMLARSWNVGSMILGSVLAGLGIGYLIDRSCGCWPWATVAGGALFIVAGLYHMVKEFSR